MRGLHELVEKARRRSWLWKGHLRFVWYQAKEGLHPGGAEEVMGTDSMERARSALDCTIHP